MPGDAAEESAVRDIFDLHFRKGWGGKRIADTLNRRGIRSPRGKQWSKHQTSDYLLTGLLHAKQDGESLPRALWCVSETGFVS